MKVIFNEGILCGGLRMHVSDRKGLEGGGVGL